jgi:hypothetical protein
MGWTEALLVHRAADDHQGFLGAALLAQDRHLFRLAATWPQVKKTLPPAPGPGEDVDLEAVWSLTRVDFEGWAELAQMNPLAVVQGFQALKGNRVIFPDGSLSHQAEALLQKEAAGNFMAKLNIKPGDLK